MGLLEWDWFNGFVVHGGVYLAYRFIGMTTWLSFLQLDFISFIKIVSHLKEKDNDVFGLTYSLNVTCNTHNLLLSNVWMTL